MIQFTNKSQNLLQNLSQEDPQISRKSIKIQVWTLVGPVGCPWRPQDHQNGDPGYENSPQGCQNGASRPPKSLVCKSCQSSVNWLPGCPWVPKQKPSRSATWQVWALKIILSSTLPVLPILQDLLLIGTSNKQPATSQQIPAVRRGPAAGAKPSNPPHLVRGCRAC